MMPPTIWNLHESQVMVERANIWKKVLKVSLFTMYFYVTLVDYYGHAGNFMNALMLSTCGLWIIEDSHWNSAFITS